MRSEYYLPALEQMRQQSRENKQGRGENLPTPLAQEASKSALRYYHQLLDLGKEGLARELTRIVLPVNIYSKFYWKIDLHNLLHFIQLRLDEHAQYEIRQYAQVLLKIVESWLPITYQAFVEYRLKASEHTSQASTQNS